MLKELLHTLYVEIRDKRQLAGELCLNTRQTGSHGNSPVLQEKKTNLVPFMKRQRERLMKDSNEAVILTLFWNHSLL